MFNKKSVTEKEYNRQKSVQVQYSIYDLQFKRFKNRVERERYRVEYDAIKAKLELIYNQIKTFPVLDPELAKLDITDNKLIAEKKSKWSDEQNRVDDEKVRLENDLKKWQDSMKFMDEELTGIAPTKDNPEGAIGIETSIEAFRDLKNVYELYTKNL